MALFISKFIKKSSLAADVSFNGAVAKDELKKSDFGSTTKPTSQAIREPEIRGTGEFDGSESPSE